jgi:hypothetical protein
MSTPSLRPIISKIVQFMNHPKAFIFTTIQRACCGILVIDCRCFRSFDPTVIYVRRNRVVKIPTALKQTVIAIRCHSASSAVKNTKLVNTAVAHR